MCAHRSTPVAGIALIALISAFATAAPAAAQTTAELRMPADAQPYRRVAEAFVASAMAGDVERSIGMLSAHPQRSEVQIRKAGLVIDDKMCEDIVELATKYLRRQNNPDKSIVTLDQSCARSVKKGHETLEWVSVAETVANQIGVVVAALERPSETNARKGRH